MIKKLVLLCLMCGCFSPGFAQGGKAGEVVLGIKRLVNQQAFQRQVGHIVSAKTSQVQFIKINHFPDHPILPLLSPADRTVYTPSAVSPTEHQPLLPARVLKPDELREMVFPPSQIYVPTPFVQAEKSLFRGMKLREISELKNILVNGLEMSKSHYVGEIFTSPSYGVATVYALPTLWGKFDDEIQVDMPVLVRISLTEEVERENPPDQFGLQWIFRHDIPAKMISDVMVFLEVDGKPGWYKAVLNNGEVGLVPVPASRVDVFEE